MVDPVPTAVSSGHPLWRGSPRRSQGAWRSPGRGPMSGSRRGQRRWVRARSLHGGAAAFVAGVSHGNGLLVRSPYVAGGRPSYLTVPDDSTGRHSVGRFTWGAHAFAARLRG